MALSIPLASTVWTKSNNPTGVAQLTAHRIQPAGVIGFSAAGVEIGDLHAGDFTSTSAQRQGQSEGENESRGFD